MRSQGEGSSKTVANRTDQSPKSKSKSVYAKGDDAAIEFNACAAEGIQNPACGIAVGSAPDALAFGHGGSPVLPNSSQSNLNA